MVGTVATGMLGNPSLIPLIIYPHYLGAITLGVLMRFYKKSNTILKLKLGNTLPNEKNKSFHRFLIDRGRSKKSRHHNLNRWIYNILFRTSRVAIYLYSI